MFHREHVLPAVGHAISGALGSALANLATYPLDVVSTRLKVQRHALTQRLERAEMERRRTEKAAGKKGKTKRRSDDESSSDDMVKGIFNVSREQEGRYQKWVTQEGDRVVETWEYEYEEDELYDGHFDAIRKIYDREGIPGFYHGIGWDTVGTVASGFWYFVAYTMLRKQRLHIMGVPKHTHLPVMEELGLGVAAAALSKLISSPFSNIVTRKQTAAMLYPNAKTPSFGDIYHDIMREKGVTGFWSGYTASLLLTLNPSITFLLYEAMKPHVIDHKGRSLDKFDKFLLAAVCQAAATTLTYPLNVVRIRSQMDDGVDESDAFYGETWSSGKKGRGADIRDIRYRRSINHANGITELLSDIIRREGIGALYIGLGGSLAKGFLSHTVNVMIKRNVHSFILRLYFFVLDAYNHSERGSFREAALEKTLSGARKAGGVAGSARRKIDSAKDKVSGFGEKVKEKTKLGYEGERRGGSSSHERLVEASTARENERSFRERSEDELLEQRFTSQGGQKGGDRTERTERTVIREEYTGVPRETGERVDRTVVREEYKGVPREKGERIDRSTIIREEYTGAAPRERGEQRNERTVIREEVITDGPRGRTDFREERFSASGDLDASRNNRQPIREEHIREEHIRTNSTTRPQVQNQQRRTNLTTAMALGAGSLVGAPPVPQAKAMEKVSHWRDKVAEETAMAAAAVAAVNNPGGYTTRHETLQGEHGERIDRTITTRESIDYQPRHRHRSSSHHRQVVTSSRQPSMASGQTYQSAGGRTSLMVHPPTSVRQRYSGGEWVEDGKLSGGVMGRVMGGGDVGVNGEVRRSGKEGKLWE